MSHVATNWAINQRGLKPATKIVLFYLADRHNPDYGCFPSQKTLAEDAEMSERSVRDHLDILEQKGLIQRTSEQDGGKFKSTRYILAFEADFQRQDLPVTSGKNEHPPAAKSADGKICRRQNLPTAKSAGHQRQNLPPNLVKEPCKITPAVREAELGKNRISSMRAAIVSELGLTGRELNTSGTFVVAGMDARNVEASLIVWSGRGLTDEQIISAIRAKIATERGKDARFMPRSIRFFDGAISDFAKRITAGSAPQQTTQHKPDEPLADPKAEAERQALMADLDRLRGSNSDAAFNRRREIVTRLQYLQTAAGA